MLLAAHLFLLIQHRAMFLFFPLMLVEIENESECWDEVPLCLCHRTVVSSPAILPFPPESTAVQQMLLQ